MLQRALATLGLGLLLVGGAACGPPVDLSKGLEVTDVLTGYYDEGVRQVNMDGRLAAANKFVSSITFSLKNTSAAPISSVHIMASFWYVGGDGEYDSTLTSAISSQGLPPGEKAPPLTIRSGIGFNLEGVHELLFKQSRYRDSTVRLFAKRGGGLFRLGEFKIDQVLLPKAGRGAPRP